MTCRKGRRKIGKFGKITSIKEGGEETDMFYQKFLFSGFCFILIKTLIYFIIRLALPFKKYVTSVIFKVNWF